MLLIKESRSFFEKQKIDKKLIYLNQTIQKTNFWNNKIEAEKILREKKNCDLLINTFKFLDKEEKDLYDIFLLAKEENNNQIINQKYI